jgi:hypothetical protein
VTRSALYNSGSNTVSPYFMMGKFTPQIPAITSSIRSVLVNPVADRLMLGVAGVAVSTDADAASEEDAIH